MYGLASVGQRNGSSIPFDAVLALTGSRRLKGNRSLVNGLKIPNRVLLEKEGYSMFALYTYLFHKPRAAER